MGWLDESRVASRFFARVLEGDLNFLAANVDVSLVLYEQHLQRTRELLADLDEAISGGPKEEE